ncbi:RNA polymerase sigma factor [Paenibacillus sp. PL91]|uniref:RNA polymerase sigma factor n=1 Tax=Paenibacillus sp. PL91 TaxID=2729538 RepID=UPI00145E69F2|nr:RNA polymerase sigma factor [Paenibacillus sp. PL91]MBC9199088.1 RNA polymerase sigma factor [Paenibacillus sp. PL91]
MILANTHKNTEMHSAEEETRKLQASVHRYCLSLTGSKWDAEDLAQDTWLKGMRAAIDSTHQNPEALLLRIAKNTWIDRIRRQNQYERIIKQDIHAEAMSDANSLELEEALLALMRHLPPRQRIVFLLRDALDFSIAETAELLNTTTGAIKAALHRAREALHAVRRELEAEEPSFDIDEDRAVLIREMAAAYQSGDLALLIELAQRDAGEAAIISGIVQNRRLQTVSRTQHARVTSNHHYSIQMAA